MADTLQNIKIPANTWVNLYAASGLTVGAKITVKNLSTITVKLKTKATSPSAVDAESSAAGSYVPLLSFLSSSNETGDSGAWAYCQADGLVNVKAF